MAEETKDPAPKRTEKSAPKKPTETTRERVFRQEKERRETQRHREDAQRRYETAGERNRRQAAAIRTGARRAGNAARAPRQLGALVTERHIGASSLLVLYLIFLAIVAIRAIAYYKPGIPGTTGTAGTAPGSTSTTTPAPPPPAKKPPVPGGPAGAGAGYPQYAEVPIGFRSAAGYRTIEVGSAADKYGAELVNWPRSLVWYTTEAAAKASVGG
jgi:hypothetical protein